MDYLQISDMIGQTVKNVRRMVACLEARDTVFAYSETPSGRKIFSSDCIEKIIRGFGMDPNDYIGKG
tara:strand:+ start:297 stop:497 length:201 start_codon:yes stop_codon:yes gene_type:complete